MGLGPGFGVTLGSGVGDDVMAKTEIRLGTHNVARDHVVLCRGVACGELIGIRSTAGIDTGKGSGAGVSAGAGSGFEAAVWSVAEGVADASGLGAGIAVERSGAGVTGVSLAVVGVSAVVLVGTLAIILGRANSGVGIRFPFASKVGSGAFGTPPAVAEP